MAVTVTTGNTASAAGLSPQSADGFGEVAGDDWAYGFSLGASYHYGRNNRIGLSYRSKSDVKVTGDAEFEVPQNAQPLTAGGFFTNSSAEAEITLPETASLGAIHWVSESFALLGEVQWTKWSEFEELRIKYGNGQPDTVVDENWDDNWRFSLGAKYKLDEVWSLRAGYTYDKTPIPDRYYRTPRIPGNTRNWLALGVGYELNEKWSLAASYAHIFVQDGSSEVRSSTGDTLIGDWDSAVDIFSANLIYRFSVS